MEREAARAQTLGGELTKLRDAGRREPAVGSPEQNAYHNGPKGRANSTLLSVTCPTGRLTAYFATMPALRFGTAQVRNRLPLLHHQAMLST